MTMIKNHRVLSFVILAYGLTWLLWLPLMLNYQFGMKIPVFTGQFYCGSFGPLAGAVLVTWAADGKTGLRSWASRCFSLKAGGKWMILAVAMPLAYAAAGILAQRLLTGAWVVWSELGRTSKLPDFGILQTGLVWMLTFGLGEETGWRGFLLPEMVRKYSLRVSALCVAGIWLAWHLPAFWFNPTYIRMGPGIAGWAVSLAFGSVLLAWITQRSRYSIVPVLLWHGGFDLITAGDTSAEYIAMVCSVVVILQGIWLMKKMAVSERKERCRQDEKEMHA